MLRPKRLAVLVAALVLTVPGTALAQSAGDQQYSDPFANQGGSGSGGGGGGGGGQSSGAQSSGSSGSAGQSSAGQGGETGSSATSATGASGTQTATGGSARELPRTGGEPGLLALVGAGLTLGGFGLRRWVRRPSD